MPLAPAGPTDMCLSPVTYSDACDAAAAAAAGDEDDEEEDVWRRWLINETKTQTLLQTVSNSLVCSTTLANTLPSVNYGRDTSCSTRSTDRPTEYLTQVSASFCFLYSLATVFGTVHQR